MLDRPFHTEEARVRVYWTLHRRVDILHRDSPRLPAGETRRRIAQRIVALEKAIVERLAR